MALRPFAAELGSRLERHRIDGVCGPLTGGAFLAQMIATDLGIQFLFAERIVTDRTGLYPVDYRIAPALRGTIRGLRVALVDDAISAGSAVRSTLADLESCGAVPVVLGALISFGGQAREFAASKQIALEGLFELPLAIWTLTECPLCAGGMPLTRP